MSYKKNNKRYNRSDKDKNKRLSSIDLFENRIIYLDGEIDDKTAREIVEKLFRLDMHNKKDIKLYINSPGGAVSSGFAIYDAMNLIKSDVSTICIGKAASMASILLLNGAKGKRYILPNAEVMIHEVSSFSLGKVTEMENKLDHSKSLNNKLLKIIADKTNMNIKQVKNETKNKDTWLTAHQALRKGFVDEILYKSNIC